MKAAFILWLTCVCAHAELLTDAKGRRINAEIGKIGKIEVGLKVDGKFFVVKLSSLSPESRALLAKMKADREAAESERQRAMEAATAAEAKAFLERQAAGRKSGAEFRGLWLGMTEADKAKVFSESSFARIDDGFWRPTPDAPDDFVVLAENDAGEKFRWAMVSTAMEEGRLATLYVASPYFDINDFRPEFMSWVEAVRKAMVQKHGQPDLVWAGDFGLLDIDEGYSSRLAVWKLSGTARAELTVTRNEDYKLSAAICYYDHDVRERRRAAKEKVKGKL